MSGHAFCTLNECVQNADKKKMAFIGITDHGPSMEHSAHEGYFEMSRRIPPKIGRIGILFGCEANIIDKNGMLDISKKIQNDLDIVMAGLHEKTPYQYHLELDNTTAMVNAMCKNRIHIVSHPYRANFPINVKEVVAVAVSKNILIEINKNLILNAISNYGDSESKKVISETSKMIDNLQLAESGYIINSDAHHTDEIGINESDFNTMKNCLGIKEKYVYNNNYPELKKYIGDKLK
jgi:putative hydrolase